MANTAVESPSALLTNATPDRFSLGGRRFDWKIDHVNE
jgi:hypothetical protein